MLSKLRLFTPNLRQLRRLATVTDFPGARSAITGTLEFRESFDPMPCYQIMDKQGKVKNESEIPEVCLGSLSLTNI